MEKLSFTKLVPDTKEVGDCWKGAYILTSKALVCLFLFLKPLSLKKKKRVFIYLFMALLGLCWGFLHSSVGKESACNARDPCSIPGSGRLPGEGIGYPLQYSWVSLVAQLVKNLPAMREIRVWSPDWKDPLEKGKATHSSILAWYSPWCHKESDATFTLTFFGSLLLGGLFSSCIEWRLLSSCGAWASLVAEHRL